MEFRVLGPLEVLRDGQPLAVGTPQMRTLLAVLLVRAGRVVAADQLVDELWPQSTSVNTRAILHAYVSRLRRALARAGAGPGDRERLVTRPPGYQLRVEPGELDLHRFDEFVARARTAREAGDVGTCVALLRQALELWRGSALADLPGTPTLEAEAARLAEYRLAIFEALFDAELATGHGGTVVPELAALSAEYPLRERFTAQLILALYRGGRQSEALAAYQRLRTGLADALGIDPGPELQALHTAVLRQDPELRTSTTPPNTTVRPAQLPPGVGAFTGRYDALKELDALLDTEDTAATVVISAIAGMGGVGKTALALHWSHRVLSRFPDGQLYVNLRGYDPAEPLSAASALEGFLRALGTDPPKIPPGLDDRAAAYRSALAGRRMLVVLDNARTVEQVRPLLPGSPDCRVVVTSRNELTGLVARDGAYRLVLDRLPEAEAAALMRRILGPGRVDSDPRATAELVRLCEGLPLALRVAAERAGRRPDAPLSDLVGELSERTGRLDLLSPAGDPYTAVRTVLSWSYEALPPEVARLLRLLGLHPGHDIDEHAAAHLAGVGLGRAQQLLAVLLSACLIEQTPAGRYHMHDLLRAYAAERAEADEGHADQHAALTRLFDHYLQTAAAAMDLVAPHERYRRPKVSQPAAPAPHMATAAAALAWLDAERVNLVTVAGHAADHGWPTYSTRMSTTLWRYANMGAHHSDAEALHSHALRAADESGDRVAYADALTDLAIGYERQGRYDEAIDHLERALAIAGATGNRFGQFRAMNSLGIVHGRLGHAEESLELHHRALAVARELEDRASEAAMLGNLGTTYEELGRYDEALHHHQQALALAREAGHRSSEAAALVNIGAVHQGLGGYQQAIDQYQQSLVLARDIGNRGIETASLIGIGDAFRLVGRHAQALDHYRRALLLAWEIGERQKEARAHAGIGHALHAATPSAPLAREHWRHALSIFTDLGAPEAAVIQACLASDDQHGVEGNDTKAHRADDTTD